MIEGFTRLIDTRRIDAEALARFRRLAVKRVMEAAPEFGAWLRAWCETEEYWRKTDPDNRPTKHVVGLPPAHTWSDRELGKALRAITSISLTPMHGTLDEFVDRLTLVISEEAAARLDRDA